MTLEYYNRDTKDLLYKMPISATTGFLDYLANVGQLNNKGVEFELRTMNFANDDFSWTTILNLTHNKNKIVSLNGIIDQSIEGNWFIHKVGLPYYTFYVKEFAGVDKQTGAAMYYKNTKNEDGSYNRELTADANEAESVPYKSVNPKISGGFTNMFSYKWFDLSLTFTYSLGGYSFDKTGTYIENGTTNIYDSRYNLPVYYEDRWQKPGDNAKFKRIDDLSESHMTSRFIEDENTLELTTLSFGYENQTASWLKTIGASSFNVRLSMNDLFHLFMVL